MDMKIVTLEMVKVVEGSTGLPEHNDEIGVDHLLDMCTAILNNKVIGEKAHRWLGYIQGCLCGSGDVTLEELKEINKGGCNNCENCDCKK